MMVMRRREGEKILIGDNISIHIAHIGRNKVKIAIEAPREISIVAEEMKNGARREPRRRVGRCECRRYAQNISSNFPPASDM